MNLEALRLPGKKFVTLHEWQTNASKNLRTEYDEAVQKMYAADRAMREVNEQTARFTYEKDSAGRDMIFYTDNHGKRSRVKLSAPKDFRREIVKPRAKAFQEAMIETRRLHFACRNAGIEVPKEVFRYLDSWGMIARRKN